MTPRKDTIFEQYLAPFFKTFLIDSEGIKKYYESRDWEAESDRFRQPNFEYPKYYAQNFHGIEKGYLSLGAAFSYDPVTQYVLPPNELWVRQGLLERIRCQPRRILDLGCGTGTMTRLLKQKYPAAEVIGIDLSPYMLVVADDKARQAGLDIRFQQGKAEQLEFGDRSFDLITASLLFHETPPSISCKVLEECFRLLKAGGEVLILDGNQAALRRTEWLTQIFEEPYIRAYAQGSVDAWLGSAGFGDIRTEEVWGVHQVSRGLKPLDYGVMQTEASWEEMPVAQGV
jgi:ubiquinone/menaquinone biosynthesis C-methylase UbiE